MATPVHYIRTIHTSFTAAHSHSPGAWAAHSSAASAARTHTHANILLNITANYNNLPPGLHPTTNTVVGRKRSASIRGVPPSYVQRMQAQRVKFDPFADDASDSVLYHTPAAAARNLVTRPNPSIPYTIQIPPAAPADIQRHHHHQQQHYRQQHQHQHQTQQPQNQYQHQHQHHHYHRSQPVRVRSPQPQSPKLPPQRVATPAPAPQPQPQALPPPPAAPVPSPAVAAKEREARSRIVAGILLNRVHAVGKPMRRRSPSVDQPKPYVPSGLSTCIAIEA